MSFGKIISVALAAFLIAACAGTPFSEASETQIYLVRHAEKEPGRDPNLTPDGKVRAQALADRLEDGDLTAIYSTNTARTRQTATPAALKSELPIIYYEANNLNEFATQILAHNGNILVVGHSNTTPGLVAALGGEPGTPIVEATEYDRLYVLSIGEGAVSTDVQRYGEPSSP